jgi:DNA-binding protein HU-beta
MKSHYGKTRDSVLTRVARETGITKAAAEEIVDAFLAAVRDQVWGEGRLVWRGFGSWRIRKRRARVAIIQRETATGEPAPEEKYRVPAHKAVVFRASENWRTSRED